MSDHDEILVILEVSEDQTEYRLTVRSSEGASFDHKEFIINLEMYLHEISQAEIAREASNGYLH